MGRASHPNKEIEEAIQYAEGNGWRAKKSKGHCWGRLLCGQGDTTGCQMSIWSTPQNPENHAKQIRRFVDRCSHEGEGE